jgi:20S proteasome subunit alpha 2
MQRYVDEMELEDSITMALLTMRDGFDGAVRYVVWSVVCAVHACVSHKGQLTSKNVEVGIVGSDGVFKVLSATEIADYLDIAD